MSTTTARLALVKETGAENYSVGTVNDNFDKVDAGIGFVPCTSTTRPSDPYNGMGIRETDTGSYYISNGTVPASGSWRPVFGVDGPVIVGNVGASAPLRVQTTGSVVGNRLIDARKVGDAQSAFTVDFNGDMEWGPGGSTVLDTTLYRSAAGVLRTNGQLVVGGALTATAVSRVTRPFCHVYQSVAQAAFADGIWTPITFNQTVLDNTNSHSTTANTTRITPTIAGEWTFRGQSSFVGNATGARAARFRKNGVDSNDSAYSGSPQSSSAVAGTAMAEATFTMNGTTDYVELMGFTTPSLATNVGASHSWVIAELVDS